MELTVLGVSFTLLLLMGVPVAFAIGLSSVATILAAGLPVAVVFQKMVGGMQVFSFLAIPFFIWATGKWNEKKPMLGVPEGADYVPLVVAGVLIVLFCTEHIIALLRGHEVAPAWN